MSTLKHKELLVLAKARRNGKSRALALGRVQAGFATWAEDEIEKDLSIDDYLVEHPLGTFLVKVAGESMVEAGILPGDVLVVDRTLTAKNGQIVIAVVDGDLTVKRLVRENGRAVLRAENQNFPKVIVPEGAEVEIWGVVVGVVRKMKIS